MSHRREFSNGLNEVRTACGSGRVSLATITHPLTQVVLTSPHLADLSSFRN